MTELTEGAARSLMPISVAAVTRGSRDIWDVGGDGVVIGIVVGAGGRGGAHATDALI